LRPQEKATIPCPNLLAGIAVGNITTAYIKIELSYKQLIHTQQEFPFKGVIDSQEGLHWTPITAEQMESELQPQAKSFHSWPTENRALYLRSVCVSSIAFRGLGCHPLTCMLLKLR